MFSSHLHVLIDGILKNASKLILGNPANSRFLEFLCLSIWKRGFVGLHFFLLPLHLKVLIKSTCGTSMPGLSPSVSRAEG